MFKNILEKISRKIKPDFHKYKIYFIISIVLGIILKIIIWKHVFFDDFVSSSNQLLNISGNSSIDHRVVSSTSASILSTIFTIIFVLLTIFIQMSGAYASADVLRNSEIKKLFRLYSATIVLSLMMLETTFQFPTIVLTLTFACILSLYPFVISISNRIQYEVGVVKLSEEIPSLIELNNESHVIGKMKSLIDIGLKSIDDNRLDDFVSIMSIFEANTKKAARQKMGSAVRKFGFDYLDVLNHFIETNSITSNRSTMINSLFSRIDYYIDDHAKTMDSNFLESQADGLRDAGIKMIKTGFDYIYVNKIVETLKHLFFSIGEKRYIDKSIECLECVQPRIVKNIGKMAAESHKFRLRISLETSVKALFAIGANVYEVNEKFEHSNSRTLDLVVKELMNIENDIISDNFERLFEDSKKSISESESKQHVKFKEYYDKKKIDVKTN